MAAILLFAVFGFRLAICVSTPIKPSDYQKIIGQGFATNWFKIADPLLKYHGKNIQDIHSKKFRNVRLRSRADLYSAPYNTTDFSRFLTSLSTVVDKCLEVGIAPIVSWIHHEAEANATEEDRTNYVSWWTAVAKKLKKKDYRLSFNLFTELGIDGRESNTSNSEESLRMRPNKYNNWTS